VQDQSALLKSAFDLIPFDIYVVDAATLDIVFVNQQLRDAIGPAERRPCWDTVYGQSAQCGHCRIPALVARGHETPAPTEIHEYHHEARGLWFQLTEKLMRWPDGRLVKYCIGADISSLKDVQNSLAEAHAQLARHAKEIEEISITDHLTGAYTRRRLDEALAAEISRASRSGHGFAVVMCDLDKFKAVNDQFGHRAGDKVLIETVAAMKGLIRRIDVLGRWGGEEFLVILPSVDLRGGQAVAEKLRAAIENHGFGEVGKRTASFGVAVHKPDETAEQLVERADQALYRAKEHGRNRVEV